MAIKFVTAFVIFVLALLAVVSFASPVPDPRKSASEKHNGMARQATEIIETAETGAKMGCEAAAASVALPAKGMAKIAEKAEGMVDRRQ